MEVLLEELHYLAFEKNILVFLLSHGCTHLCSFSQAKIKGNDSQCKKNIAEEVKEYLLNMDGVKQTQVNRSILKEKSKIRVPDNIIKVSDLHQLLKSLRRYLDHFINIHNIKDDMVKLIHTLSTAIDTGSDDFFEVRACVKVRWTKEEIGNSGWRSGWYVAEVQKANPMLDQIEVVYISEPESVYKIDVTCMLAKGKLQLSR